MSGGNGRAADGILKFPNSDGKGVSNGAAARKRTPTRRRQRPVLITGGSGFVGTNLAHRLCSAGERVLVYDNLSRAGVEQNASWLCETHGDLLQLEDADVRNAAALAAAVRSASAVYRLAAEVAVTSSLALPIEEFRSTGVAAGALATA